MTRRLSTAFALLFLAAFSLFAQGPGPGPGPGGPRPPLPNGIGGAVLLAENSIQLERNVAILSGDVIVNNAASGPILGERELSLDRGVTTPEGFRIVANGIDIDKLAIAGGIVAYNVLTNDGSITGSQVTPVLLPVFSHLPPPIPRFAGTEDVNVGEASIATIDEGDYQDLIVLKDSRVDFTGGGYTFRNITLAKGVSLRFLAGANVLVTGRIYTNKEVTIGPHSTATISPSQILIQTQGTDGADGSPAVWIGHRSTVKANMQATSGTLVFEHEVDATGSFIGRNIRAGQYSRFSISSANNSAPVAEAQSVFTDGIAPVTINLEAADPEGYPLQFTIATQPQYGTLSPLPPQPVMSASVTYTPASAANVTDYFSFRVRDNAGASGTAMVSINPGVGDTPPVLVGTVAMHDQFFVTAQEIPALLRFGADAPPGVTLSFSVVPSTGPFHGTLGQLVHAPEFPVRHAAVPYTPDAGFNGDDTFQLDVCGVINGSSVCDSATVSIRVMPKRSEPPQPQPVVAADVNAATTSSTQIAISLSATVSSSISGAFVSDRSGAVAQIRAVMAGAVADANNDGIGDNVNPLPGPAPAVAFAGRGQTGPPGASGQSRFEIEFDIAAFTPAGVNSLAGASITLPTMRGPVDTLPTHFWLIGENNDGALTNADYARAAERIPGVLMPVPLTQPVGSPGTFTFDALPALKGAVAAGQNYLTIQGRVDPIGPLGRGLGIRTTAGPNLAGGIVPSLTISTPGLTAPLIYHVASLPQNGTLLDSFDNAITSVPYMLTTPIVKYMPNAGFLGTDTFTFSVSNGQSSDTGTATIVVSAPDCGVNEEDCDNGR